MAELFHVTERGSWAEAVEAGEYRISTRGLTLAEQGFIHCSWRTQLRGVAERFYADLGDLVVLIIDPERLGCPVRVEEAEPGGELFPHIYGPLPVAAVTQVIPVGRDAAGRLVLPE